MARIRSIRPEFWRDGDMAELTRDTRLLYIGMWCFADDGGVLPARAHDLRLAVFPGDRDISTDDVERMVRTLVDARRVTEYTVCGKPWWRVLNWSHQRPLRPTYRYPQEDGVVPMPPPRSKSKVVSVTDREHGTDMSDGSHGGVGAVVGKGEVGTTTTVVGHTKKDRPPKQSKKRRPPPVESRDDAPPKHWSKRTVDVWREYAGEIAPGRLNRAITKLVEEHGDETVLLELTRWLVAGNAKFGPENFAQQFKALIAEPAAPIELWATPIGLKPPIKL